MKQLKFWQLGWKAVWVAIGVSALLTCLAGSLIFACVGQIIPVVRTVNPLWFFSPALVLSPSLVWGIAKHVYERGEDDIGECIAFGIAFGFFPMFFAWFVAAPAILLGMTIYFVIKLRRDPPANIGRLRRPAEIVRLDEYRKRRPNWRRFVLIYG